MKKLKNAHPNKPKNLFTTENTLKLGRKLFFYKEAFMSSFSL